jgi:hypothetical protein
LAAWTVGLLLGAAGSAQANTDSSTDDLQWHGFFGQSLLRSSSNNLFGQSKDRFSADYTEAGINGSWRAHPAWLLSAQVLGRHAGASDPGKVRLDYAFVSYTPWATENGRLSLIAGKSKLPYGLYNDTRDTPSVRPSILLPQSIYLDRLRDSYQSGSGLHLQAEQNIGPGSLSFRFANFKWVDAGGRNAVLGLLGSTANGDFTGKQSWTGQLMYQSANEKFRAGVTEARIRLRYQPGLGDAPVFGNGQVEFAPRLWSAQWQEERWSLSGEYLTRQMKYNNFSPAVNNNIPGTSYYLQGLWHMSTNWDWLLRRDIYYMDSSDPSGSRFAATPVARARGLAAWSRYAKDWTIGVRHRFAPGWQLAGEVHRIEGTGWMPLADNPNPRETGKDWNLLLLQLSYQF